jgi:uncharacterized protein
VAGGEPATAINNGVKRGEDVVIPGASPKPDRYAFRAFHMLREYGHRPIPVNPAYEEILGERCYSRIEEVPRKVDTITVYLGQGRSDPLIDDSVAVAPRRIIMADAIGDWRVELCETVRDAAPQSSALQQGLRFLFEKFVPVALGRPWGGCACRGGGHCRPALVEEFSQIIQYLVRPKIIFSFETVRYHSPLTIDHDERWNSRPGQFRGLGEFHRIPTKGWPRHRHFVHIILHLGRIRVLAHENNFEVAGILWLHFVVRMKQGRA